MINEIEKIEFKKKYNLTFVFQTKTTLYNDIIASSEITPLGIIYTNEKDYYFAPLCEDYNISEIVKEYVENDLN